MSALGQKQTCAPQKGMSALPPIATKKADITPHRFCELEQTAKLHLGQKLQSFKQQRSILTPPCTCSESGRVGARMWPMPMVRFTHDVGGGVRPLHSQQ